MNKSSASERSQYQDPETGRTVTFWTGDTGNTLGLYYHQNAFDAQRRFVYFASDRGGSWQAWRVSLDDGRLTQVTDFEGYGEFCMGGDEVESQYYNAVFVSPRSGKVFACGRQRVIVIDPDTLKAQTIYDQRRTSRHRDDRYLRDVNPYPSCDDRWLYFYSIHASDAEFETAKQFALAVFAARQRAGLPARACYPHAPYGMGESPFETVISRIEVATGKVEELWRDHKWIQHVAPSPSDPDLVSFNWSVLQRRGPSTPKYFLMRAGEKPRVMVCDEENSCVFHHFWHPDGSRWYTHACENLEPVDHYAPIPGKMKFYVCEVDINAFLKTGEQNVKRWYETAGEKHVHLHVNIAPDGSYLLGDGQSDVPYVCRLDWQSDRTLSATPLCRTEYGFANSPNVQVSPDGKLCFFHGYRGGRSYLTSVELG